ncbi:hypothetical protein F2Q69_00047653 [Brassica cretica]|uniref:Uncharacterized protein n=1 Tax=Brassica cretica TaxID=69181 RepID=A0A8S9PNB3_BRACR|nr:hypothetical protein F2Q69_00047653 [Brassica cretica]
MSGQRRGFFQPFRSLLSSASSPSGDPSFTSSKKTLFDPRNRTVITASPCYDTASFLEHFAGDLKQNSGLGIALLSITASAKVKISPFVTMLSAFVSAVVAWFFAQTSKMVINFFIERKWDLSLFLIVMYDGIGVRRHAGMQAEVLNLIIRDLFEGHLISQGVVIACFCCQGPPLLNLRSH